MKILLSGYGQMGKEIEKILLSRGHVVSAIVDPMVETAHKEISAAVLADADVVIDFSSPAAVLKNCTAYAQGSTPVVLGTTGWGDKYDQIKAMIEKAGIGFVWGSNFSIGAHMLFKLASYAASLTNAVPDYDIMVHEMHHKLKKDSPSGTAITLAEKILANCDRKTKIVTQCLDRRIEPEELHVSSTRGGSIPGIHTMYMDSPADTIEITHNARSRGGFALGAVMAAEWIKGKKGFYSVEDFIKEILP